jgi:large subunit ribosomal protein L25
METTVLTVTAREQTGTRAVLIVRKEGGMPANITGGGQPTQVITVNRRDFDAAVRKGFRAFELELDGAKTRVLLQEVQWDSMGDDINHVEFLRDADGSIFTERTAIAKAKADAAELL